MPLWFHTDNSSRQTGNEVKTANLQITHVNTLLLILDTQSTQDKMNVMNNTRLCGFGFMALIRSMS